MYKFLSYLNGLKDGMLVLLVPLSFIIGAIIMVVSFLRIPEIREPINEIAESFKDDVDNNHSDKKNETKIKMGFNLD